MTRRVRVPAPPGGWPWEQPGFRFFTPGFPPGYTPKLAEEAALSPQKRAAVRMEQEKSR